MEERIKKVVPGLVHFAESIWTGPVITDEKIILKELIIDVGEDSRINRRNIFKK